MAADAEKQGAVMMTGERAGLGELLPHKAEMALEQSGSMGSLPLRQQAWLGGSAA